VKGRYVSGSERVRRWAFRRQGRDTRFLLLCTSEENARRYFSGGRFWQIPSDRVEDDEAVSRAIARELNRFGLTPKTIWAGEHAYIIYNRRFAEMQIIGVMPPKWWRLTCASTRPSTPNTRGCRTKPVSSVCTTVVSKTASPPFRST
jgi:hypothetical protein